MVFTAQQLQEKCHGEASISPMTFVDLTKAFDSVNREVLWKILSKAGCPEKFLTILKLLHNKMSARVLLDIDESDAFEVKTGVK